MAGLRDATFLVNELWLWLSVYAPNGSEGLVLENVDLVVRHFGPTKHFHDLDADGRYMLVEVKNIKEGSVPRAGFGMAQRRTFGLIDKDLRAGSQGRYLGYWKLSYDGRYFTEDNPFVGITKTPIPNDYPDTINIWLNGKKIDTETFKNFIMGRHGDESIPPPYEFN